MIPTTLQELKKFFAQFPSVGPRQAERYAFFLLNRPQQDRLLYIDLIKALDNIYVCAECFVATENNDNLCALCKDSKRNKHIVCVVQQQNNITHIEKTNIYQGVYFMLGGIISPIHTSETVKQRIRLLTQKLKNEHYKELILALSNTREGNFTSLYIQETLKKNKVHHITITTLGRGLASGNELEYIDQETLKNALSNRK